MQLKHQSDIFYLFNWQRLKKKVILSAGESTGDKYGLPTFWKVIWRMKTHTLYICTCI